jgi:predicted ATPase
MIKRLFASNIGCFQKLDVTLEPLTVFIGPNASGKSTVLRALRALALLVRSPLQSGQGEMRLAGFAGVRDFFRDAAAEASIGCEVETPNGTGEYSVTLAVEPTKQRVEITAEVARWTTKAGDQFAYDSSKDTLKFDYRGATISTSTPRAASLPFLAHPYYQGDKSWRTKLNGLYELAQAFSPFYVYRFSPNAIAQPAPPGESVAYDGGGLAAEMDRLLGANRAGYDGIVDELKKRFDHLTNLHIRTVKTQRGSVLKLLEFELSNSGRIPASLESDGVLLTLAHLWLALQQEHPAVGVEEPENAAYPSLVKDRLQTLRSLAKGEAGRRAVQVLTTSHSPTLLMYLGNTQAVRVCERDGRVYVPPEKSMLDVVHTRLAWTVEG